MSAEDFLKKFMEQAQELSESAPEGADEPTPEYLASLSATGNRFNNGLIICGPDDIDESGGANECE